MTDHYADAASAPASLTNKNDPFPYRVFSAIDRAPSPWLFDKP
jgi:hypothetical protein